MSNWNFKQSVSILRIFSILVGVIFLISGFGKILDTTSFGFLIDSYGFGWAVNLAPVIVIVEILIGILLIWGIQLHRVSLFAIFMLVVFTVAYGYGYWANGVENCGCFGVVSKTKTPFWLVLLRNVFLIYFMAETYRRTTIEPLLVKRKTIILFFIVVTVTYVSGLTYYPPMSIPSSDTESGLMNESISILPASLNQLLSSDSTYVVYVFSYNCPHCWNSIENLKQYANLPEIDRVIGITSLDTTNRVSFQLQFNPQFSIYDMPSTITETLVKGFPTTFYIKNGYIKHVIEGELPCSYFFKKTIESKLKDK